MTSDLRLINFARLAAPLSVLSIKLPKTMMEERQKWLMFAERTNRALALCKVHRCAVRDMDIHKQKGNLILSHLGDCLKENHLQKLFKVEALFRNLRSPAAIINFKNSFNEKRDFRTFHIGKSNTVWYLTQYVISFCVSFCSTARTYSKFSCYLGWSKPINGDYL